MEAMADNLTEAQAITLAESKFWESMTFRQRAEFQLFTTRLCMPFGVFHEAVEKALGRSVWTHEFAMNYDGIRNELMNGTTPPTMQEIIDMIPAEKRIVINI